ncbi:uncharacterized protein LODBEIA_P50290 [Lodderomyces beijingensis]|uniref:Protein ROT1 n=1 Tax=Lodderomyces beijingensis TaxID=1775926 RepID=A0ABP0ZUC3_9ASCO
MLWPIPIIAALLIHIATTTSTQTQTPNLLGNHPQIHGIWQSQNARVMTGPAFYDPATEHLIEPTAPGTCFTFESSSSKNNTSSLLGEGGKKARLKHGTVVLDSGWFETSQYLIFSNAQNHSCPKAQLIWMHGHYHLLLHHHRNYRLQLHPVWQDGRQLVSDPCADHGVSTYARFEQKFLEYGVTLAWDGYFEGWKLEICDEADWGRKKYLWLRSRDVSGVLNPRDIERKSRVFVDIGSV